MKFWMKLAIIFVVAGFLVASCQTMNTKTAYVVERDVMTGSAAGSAGSAGSGGGGGYYPPMATIFPDPPLPVLIPMADPKGKPKPAPKPVPLSNITHSILIDGNGNKTIMTNIAECKDCKGAPILPYRRFLTPNKSDAVLNDPNDIASFVVFTHKPNDAAEKATYVEVCNKWINNFETKEAVEAVAPKFSKLIPFYYPTELMDTTGHSCDKDLYNYSYARAKVIIAFLKDKGVTAGPILAIHKKGQWLMVDLSKFTPPDIKRAFEIWQQEVCSESNTGIGFTMHNFRESFRSLLQQYGDTIVSSVTSK